MEDIIEVPATTQISTASLEHLTGPTRGTASWLTGIAVDIFLDNGHRIRIAEPDSEHPQVALVARLHFSGSKYEIEA